MITIYYSSDFKKSLKKYHSLRKQIETRLKIFLKDPYDPRLKTHKLTGELAGYWSFSINYHLRIIFEFIDQQTVGLVDIGTHSVYEK